MDLSVHTLFFSPTGGTRKAASLFAHSFSSHVEEHSLEQPVTGFSSDDFVVVALPVFTGRLPAYAREKLKAINGGGAKTVAMTVYGNRDFEDALLELQDLLIEQNFRPVAAIAAVAQHSMMSSLAAHRPDEQDGAQLAEFAQKVAEKLVSCDCCNSPCVPGNRPYREPDPTPVIPATNENCVQCGLCAARCPVGAIDPADPSHINPTLCILCMRCAGICPTKAKDLPSPVRENISAFLSQFQANRRPNQLFL